MHRISRHILIGALTLIFLGTGCGVIARPNPTPVWTVPPGGAPVLPTTTIGIPATPTGTSVTPGIPITGENFVSMQCQFCVADETHAMLVFPVFASFDVSSTSPVTCLTADMVNDQRIVICRGAQSSTFNLKICSDPNTCLEYPVALQPCPLLQAGPTPTPFATVFLTPINTLEPPTANATGPANTAVPSNTPTGVPATATPPVIPPTLPVPTTAVPPPTGVPLPTDTPSPQYPMEPTTATGGNGADAVELVISGYLSATRTTGQP